MDFGDDGKLEDCSMLCLPALFSAGQWVTHGHVLVNNSVINLPGYQLKGGDIITVAPNKSGRMQVQDDV